MSDVQHHPARTAHGIEAGAVEYPFTSWSAAMRHRLEHHGDAPWLTYVGEDGTDRTWTSAEFVDEASRLATVLRQRGVERGNRVAIAGHNHPDTIAAYFACWMLGACAVPLNMSEDDQRLAYILGHSQSTVLLCRTEYLQRIGSLECIDPANILEVDTDAADSHYVRTLAEGRPLPFHSDVHLWDDCLLVYTSGTTGNPKGVVLIQQNLFADGFDIAAWHGVDSATRMMCVLPVHHVNGTIVTHVAPFLVGASVVLHRKFSVSRFFPSIARYGVHIVSVVPTLLAFLLEARADDHGVVAGGFRHVICGAGPLTCDLADRFETAYGIPIVHGYGLSETTCYTCFIPRDLAPDEHRHWLQDFGYPSIGVALPCNEMAIHDAMGNAVAEGERGEIVARGTNIMRGYDGNPGANAEAFAYDWFRSGDEGFYKLDAHGQAYYFITGRLKELIIRGGVNLAPLEIDEVISRAPGVRAGICVGFEHNMYGEEIGALVVRDHDTVCEADVLAYCKQHLPFSKAPKVVLFTEALPVTSTGKYQRNKVKYLFAQYQDVNFNV